MSYPVHLPLIECHGYLISDGVGAELLLLVSSSHVLHPCPTPPLQAQLLSLCENSVLYLWSLEEVVPEVLHKITFSQDNSYNK